MTRHRQLLLHWTASLAGGPLHCSSYGLLAARPRAMSLSSSFFPPPRLAGAAPPGHHRSGTSGNDKLQAGVDAAMQPALARLPPPPAPAPLATPAVPAGQQLQFPASRTHLWDCSSAGSTTVLDLQVGRLLMLCLVDGEAGNLLVQLSCQASQLDRSGEAGSMRGAGHAHVPPPAVPPTCLPVHCPLALAATLRTWSCTSRWHLMHGRCCSACSAAPCLMPCCRHTYCPAAAAAVAFTCSWPQQQRRAAPL